MIYLMGLLRSASCTGSTARWSDTNDWSDLLRDAIGDFWANLASATGASNPTLIDRVWVANRCLQMNANAISTMPLRFYG